MACPRGAEDQLAAAVLLVLEVLLELPELPVELELEVEDPEDPDDDVSPPDEESLLLLESDPADSLLLELPRLSLR